MNRFFACQNGRKVASSAFALFLILSAMSGVRAVGKNDLQVTIEMKNVVSPGEKGTISITYKNVGKYKIAFGKMQLSSSALTLDDPLIEFELAPGEQKTAEVGFKVKPEEKGENSLYVAMNFCTEVTGAIPPCPVFNNNLQYQFKVEENIPLPTTGAPVVTKKLEVTLLSPSPNATFTTQDVIPFQATTSASGQVYYVWESNIDGLLSQSQSFERTLSEGTHTIKLTAKSGTQTTEATVEILVNKSEVAQTTAPPSQTPAPKSEGSNLTPFIIFVGVLSLLALIAVGIVMYFPRKKSKKKGIDKHITLNICPSCGRNNSSTASRCWKCKAPLR